MHFIAERSSASVLDWHLVGGIDNEQIDRALFRSQSDAELGLDRAEEVGGRVALRLHALGSARSTARRSRSAWSTHGDVQPFRRESQLDVIFRRQPGSVCNRAAENLCKPGA